MKSNFEEEVMIQPDMIYNMDGNQMAGEYYISYEDSNGNQKQDTVKVVPTSNRTKDYIFSTETSDAFEKCIVDPGDMSPVYEMLADAYLSDEVENDTYDLLAYANSGDNLIFNTSKNGKIKIPFDEIKNYFAYIQRNKRFAAKKGESVTGYLNRMKNLFLS